MKSIIGFQKLEFRNHKCNMFWVYVNSAPYPTVLQITAQLWLLLVLELGLVLMLVWGITYGCRTS